MYRIEICKFWAACNALIFMVGIVKTRSSRSKVEMKKQSHMPSIKTALKSTEEAWINRLPKGS
jgi:hypothetical protein